MSERRCQCPCGHALPIDARANRLYIDETHKDRAKRARLRTALEAAGLPATLTLENVRAMSPKNGSGHPARTRARRPQRRRDGVTIYLPSVEMAESVHDHVKALAGEFADHDVADLKELATALDKALERRRKRG